MFPPGRDNWSFQHHLGIAYVQAYLKRHGIISKQVVPKIGSTLNDCVNQLLATGANIIGFSCYDANYFLVQNIASLIKRARPNSFVIAGGPTATFSDELLLTTSQAIDFCVRFEGEEATLELVSQLLDGTSLDSLEDIAGITYRYKNSIVKNEDRRLFGSNDGNENNLDKFPSPYLERVLDGTEGTGILSARGCTYHCTYCNFSAMSKHTIRYHSIERVIDELLYIQAAEKAKYPKPLSQHVVEIYDDAFTINIKRAKNICKRIIDEGIRLHLSCQCRADNIDEELIELLSQAGFIEICIGVESAVPRVLRNIKKVCKNRQMNIYEDYAPEERFLLKVKEAVSLAKRYNIKTNVSIILGLPGEKIEDSLKTIEFVRDLDVS
jgi:anaerobic magnesium-protoporphyrin IX monomethyl ester cyclase